MSELVRQEYDFAEKNVNDLLTADEIEHFEEGMLLKNKSIPAESVDFGRAVKVAVKDLDELFP
jgi:hypothetical protein